MALRDLLPFGKNAPTNTPAQIEQGMSESGMDSVTAYGPGRPLNPVSGYSQRGRQMDYPLSVNIAIQSRTIWGRTPYPVLRALIDSYDVARMCINHKIDELRSMELMFVPLDGHKGADVDGAIDAARAALEYPDRQMPYEEWVSAHLENALRYDAAPLYRRRNMAGEVIGLEVMDGTTVLPYIDEFGRRPKAPSPAFYQVIHGQVFDWFTSDDVSFSRFRPQTDSPFGLAPIESILLTANTDLRFQWHFLQMFTEGSIPGGFMEMPPDVTSPDQMAEWQDYWDATVMGDQAKLHQFVAVPHGMSLSPFKPQAFDSTFVEYLMARTCSAYGVTPQDIGLVKDVNRANGETQVDIQFRVNTLPWVLWLQGILTRYVRYDLGLPVQVRLDTGRDKEDRLAEAQAWALYVQNGFASPDEARTELLGLPVDNENPMQRYVFTARAGAIPLSAYEAVAGPTDPEAMSPLGGAPLPHKPFSPIEGVAPQKPPDVPPLAVQRYPADNPASVAAAVAAADAPVTKEVTAGFTSGTGVEGHDLRTGDEEPVVEPQEEPEDVAKSELAAFQRFVKARVKAGKWRDFQFDTTDPVTAHRLNNQGRAGIRKAAGQLVAAGLCVLAQDTGQILMLQRGSDPTDPASGMWEFPGGHIEDGEAPDDAATREWQEETGLALPDGEWVGDWFSPNGVYGGFIYEVPNQHLIPIYGARDDVANPDDPDGDVVERLQWWRPEDLNSPAVRDELRADAGVVQAAIKDRASVVVVKAADAGPKVSWRDSANKTPQHEVDLRLTDFYTPVIQQALLNLVSRSAITAAAASAAQLVVKDATSDAKAAMAAEVASELADHTDPADLETAVRAIIADGYLAGAGAAARQLGPGATVVEGATGELVSGIDWDTWEPGDVDAAIASADGGLADLLGQAGVTVQGIQDTALTSLGNRIADGLLNGDSVDTIAATLGDWVTADAAVRIAHTETARAVTQATLDTYTANGVGEWDLILSDGACPECEDIAAANPHPVSDRSDAAPVHPFCRCSASPVVSSISGANVVPVDAEAP